MNRGDETSQQRSFRWRLILALTAIIVIVLVGRRHAGELNRLSEVHLGWAAVMVLLFLIARLINGEVLRQTVHSTGYDINRKEAFFLTMLRSYASMLIPRAGFGAAGIYLKKKCGVKYAEYGAMLLPIALMQCLVIGLLGLSSLTLLHQFYAQPFPPLISAAFVASAVLGGGALLFHVTVPDHWPGKIANFVRRLSTAWRQLSRDKILLGRLIGLHILLMFVRAARLQVGFWSLGVSANFIGVLVASLLADLMVFVSITPNALGFRETAIVFGARVSDVSNAVSLVVAILDRLIVTGTVIVATQIGLWRMPELRSAEEKSKRSSMAKT